MTTRVYLIRHGETDWNAAGRWQGHAPVPLNESGLTQSAALGRYLAQHNVTLAALYSSDLKRAFQTAAAVAEALAMETQTDTRLRETDLGVWQGMTRTEVEAWDGERYAELVADWYTGPRPGGESRQQVETRMRAVFDAIIARHTDQTVALVSHGGSLGMLLRSVCGAIKRPDLSNTSVTIVERAAPDAAPDAAWQLARVAWTPHLDDGAALGETW
ncbi:MAG: histidine phosphatase family protein [Anaerolineae bacterium]|nr:histidine phosphatase family protein [Anaerolineae bacterium]